ncbi:LysR family transcriptional regulator [Cohnella caldifontis]|uniref:LysR family transcriptional regulator n=1 Tax=Cohnella caldifontis TaxID=3027471 RepID=UPI0023EB2C61|nr:LysR family transcriptional regulator [Cohnella sp. YIM B05605]
MIDRFNNSDRSQATEEGFPIEIRQLQSFKAVVDRNGFTKAAHALQYSQASITAHIQQLEDELGAPLFDRIGKQIVLTPVGQELYACAAELLAAYAKIKSISPNGTDVKGEIRIGASETMTVFRLGPALARFKKLYPEVAVSLLHDRCPTLREKLHSGELDFAVTLEPKFGDPQLVTEVISEERLVFVAERSHPAETIEQAGGDCFIFTEKNDSLRRFAEGVLAKMGIAVSSHLEFSSMEAIKQCVASGLGVSLIPYVSAEGLLRDNRVRVLKAPGEEEMILYGQLHYHRNKWLSKAHRKFIEMVLNVKE